MNEGWVRLYRCLLDKAIWKCSTPEQKCVMIACLLMANHESNQWIWKGNKFQIEKGQFITSLHSLSEKTGVTIQNVRTSLANLEKAEFLTNESTKTGRLITIVNWGIYQPFENEANKEANKEVTKHQQRGNKAVTTNNNDNNDKNDKNINKYNAHFEEVWKIYPRKKDKARAFQCYMARINSGFSEEELYRATEAYAKECEKEHRPEKYIKVGSTFFGVNAPFVDYLKEGESDGKPNNTTKQYTEEQLDRFAELL